MGLDYQIFIIFLMVGVVLEFIFAVYLFNQSYCGTPGICNPIVSIENNVPVVKQCVSNSDIVNLGSSSSKTTIIALSSIVFIVALVFTFLGAKDLHNNPYITSKTQHYVSIFILIFTIIFMFAFTAKVYNNCLTDKCTLPTLPLKPVVDSTNDYMIACVDNSYEPSDVYNLYVGIIFLLVIIGILFLIYMLYPIFTKSSKYL
jgi:hypothetical protein